MGNCGKTISNLFSKKPTENQTKGVTTQCNKCKRIFGPETTNEQFNIHLQNCGNSSNVEISEEPQQQLPNESNYFKPRPTIYTKEAVNNNDYQDQIIYKVPQDDFQDFLWAKIPTNSEQNTFRWEQRKINNQKSIDYLQKLKNDEVQQLSFQEKQLWFRYFLQKRRIPWQEGADWLRINHDNVLLTSLASIQFINLHKQVKIEIQDDIVQDAGGLLREWMFMIIKEIFHPHTGMFVQCDTDEVTYKINHEAENDEHIINCFKLFGKIIGQALFERIPLNTFLDRTIIRNILGQLPTLEDIQYYDKQLFNSWNFILESNFNENEFLGYFVIAQPGSKGTEQQQLKAGGRNLMLDNKNQEQYVNLCIQNLTYQSVKPFVDAIVYEIYQVIPKELITVFDVNQFEMLLNGVPFISIDDWEFHTEYKGAYHQNHIIIKWFWDVLKTYNQEELGKMLHFCTGSSRTPVQGFRKLESNRGNMSKFTIQSVPYAKDQPYPKAHTCFNRLELPMYPTAELMEQYIQLLIKVQMQGLFGLQ